MRARHLPFLPELPRPEPPAGARRAPDLEDASPASLWCGENRVPAGDREPGDLRSGNPSDPPALPIGEGDLERGYQRASPLGKAVLRLAAAAHAG